MGSQNLTQPIAEYGFNGSAVTINTATTTNLVTVLKANFHSDIKYGFYLQISQADFSGADTVYTLNVTTNGATADIIATRNISAAKLEEYDSTNEYYKGNIWLETPVDLDEITTDLRISITVAGTAIDQGITAVASICPVS